MEMLINIHMLLFHSVPDRVIASVGNHIKNRNLNLIIYLFVYLGQRFALLEEKVVLSNLLRRFRFTYDSAKYGPARPCAELILKPTDGRMPLIVSCR